MKKTDLQGLAAKASLSFGNKKLVSTSETQFVIWSIPAVKTCPFATDMCKASCYARKAERVYPECLPAREKNLAFSETEEFVPFMVDAFHYLASLKAYRNAQHITVRIHESGDFYSFEYLMKWIAISEQCKDIPNIDFTAYTKSLPYLAMAVKSGYNLKDSSIRFISSIWADTKEKRVQETKELNLPIYTAFAETNWNESYTACECKDCGHCRQCFHGDKAQNKIAVKIH